MATSLPRTRLPADDRGAVQLGPDGKAQRASKDARRKASETADFSANRNISRAVAVPAVS